MKLHCLIPLGAIAGITYSVLPASAITLTQTSPNLNWKDLGWAVEGRTGGSGYEFAIGPDGAQSTNTGTINQNWVNGVVVPWSLTWNGITAAFNIGPTVISSTTTKPVSQTITYKTSATSPQLFNGFYLLTKVKTETGKVAPGTSLQFFVTGVNLDGSVPDVGSISTAPQTNLQQQLTQPFFLSDTPITSLQGFAKLSWLPGTIDPNLQGGSRVSLKIRGYSYTPPQSSLSLMKFAPMGMASIEESVEEKEAPIEVPEPTSGLALFALAGMVMGTLNSKIRKS